MKKLLTAFLTLALALTCICLCSTRANAATVDSGSCGKNLTWTLDDAGTLTISGTGAMYNYSFSSSSPTYSTHPWKNIASSIKSVIIGNSVTTIGSYAFRDCSSLTSVTIGDSVTTIGEDAFSFCDSLTSVTIGDSVTTIERSAFFSCTSLTSVTIPDSVTTIGEDAFFYCDSLTSVTIGDSVTTIGVSAFSDCTSLIGIFVNENNTAYSSDDRGVLFNKKKTMLMQAPGGITGSYTIPNSVTTIGEGAFSGCTSLTSVTIGDSVTTIGGSAFWGCNSLTSVTIPDSVTTIDYYAFYSCTSLTSVTIGDSVQTIGEDAFAWCTSLTSVTIGDSVTTIGNYAFEDCSSLTSVTIGDSVTTIGGSAFWGCNSLENVYYAGTSNQWSAISIGSGNTCLTNATIHYVHIHDYSLLPPVTVAATCVETGYIEYTCICGETHREILPQLPHSYPETGTVVAPTCTQEGYTDVTCTRCGAVHKKNPVPALGHSMVEIPAVAPTCTETGLTAGTHCERCQMVGIAQTEIPATGHSFADGICSACGEPECAPGDLTGDGNINSLDGLLLMRYLNGWDVNITAEAAMDVNGDGNVNSLDGLLLMRYLNGWNVELG